jgi:hypothetical protein
VHASLSLQSTSLSDKTRDLEKTISDREAAVRDLQNQLYDARQAATRQEHQLLEAQVCAMSSPPPRRAFAHLMAAAASLLQERLVFAGRRSDDLERALSLATQQHQQSEARAHELQQRLKDSNDLAACASERADAAAEAASLASNAANRAAEEIQRLASIRQVMRCDVM